MKWLESVGMRSFSKHSLLAIFIAATAISTVAQVNQLTRDQYTETVDAAYHASQNAYPKKQTVVERKFNYKGQVLSLTNEIDEWTANETERRVVEVTSGGKSEKTEVIWIGGDYYCRRDGGKWTLEPVNCLTTKGWGLVTETSQTYTSEATTLNGQKATLLRVEHKGRDFENGPTAYFRDELWIGKDGMIIQEKMSRGPVNANTPMWSRNEVFQYHSADIKIERPIEKQ
jgi:hypothetical protein